MWNSLFTGRIITMVFLGILYSLRSFAFDVAVIHPDIKELNDVALHIKERLTAEKFTIVEEKVEDKLEMNELEKLIDKNKPNLLILFDNHLLSHALKINQKRGAKAYPIISVMSLNLKQTIKNEKTATGIAYEVPPFLLVTSFNNLLEKKVHKIGVIYRKELFDWYITEAKTQLNYEKISIDDFALTDSKDKEKTKNEIAEAFKGFVKNKVEAFWLVADNAIINQDTLPILQKLARESKIPYLCGVKKFAESAFDLCSYSVTPDSNTIVDQSVEQTLAILKDSLRPVELKVEYLENVKKTLNLQKLEGNGFNTRKDALSEVEVTR